MPMVDEAFMKKTMQTLMNNPTGADIDFLIEAHTRIGYVAAEAQGEADFAYAVRKNAEADAWKTIMSGPEKVSVAAADRLAELEVWDLRQAEIKAAEKSKKINNLLDSIREAVNGIKFLGRHGG